MTEKLHKNATVMVRCDASISIGTGHLFRCRALAREFKDRGHRVVFFCRDHADSLHVQLLNDEFELVNLPRCSSSSLDKPRTLYSQWLACTQLEDAEDCIEVVRGSIDLCIDFVIVDHYGLDQQWEMHIADHLHSPKLLAIDDLANRRHYVDWLVDSGRIATWSDSAYSNRVNSNCQLLLGPRYSSLGSEYRNQYCFTKSRNKLKRVLVFFGGVDQSNWCSVALSALRCPQFLDLEVDVVLGKNAPHSAQIKELVATNPLWSFFQDVPSLCPFIARADVALGAAGVHSWERACLGLPAVAVAVAENQIELLKTLKNVGAVLTIRDSMAEDVSDQFTDVLTGLLQNGDRLKSMSLASESIVDVYGVYRVAAHMLGVPASLSLRPAIESDSGLYFWWANDPIVRQSSLKSEPISWQTHSDWFVKKLGSESVLMRVLVDENSLPIGQIRFERCSDRDNHVVLSFSLDRLARGKGLALRLLFLGLADLKEYWGRGIKVMAQVKLENVLSVRVFESAGFLEMSSPDQSIRQFTFLS